MYFTKEKNLRKQMQKLWDIRPLSPTLQKTKFMSLSPRALSVIEDVALKEAKQNAATSGRLFMHKSKRDDSGRRITTYEGDPSAWMNHFKSTGYVAHINKDAGMREETVKLREGQRIQVVDR